MALIGEILGGYSPTGAFSFEIWKRNKNTNTASTRLAETFFLLSPEEYSMEENYKLSVNKTIGGAWIDDFGNDVKNISLSGSIYSFYIGTPSTAFASTGNPGRDIGKTALKSAKELAGNITSSVGISEGLDVPFGGIAGINEFFKLRFILSRIRDGNPEIRTNLFDKNERELLKSFPELTALANLAKEETISYNNIMIIYHDYDDGNHYEVVINKFEARRSKDDPFTINYSIGMVALRQVSNDLKTYGRINSIANFKETYKQILSSSLDSLSTILDTTSNSITGIPLTFKDTYNSTKQAFTNFRQLLTDFQSGLRNDFSIIQAESNSLITRVDNDVPELIAQKQGATQQEIEDEDVELDSEILELYNLYKSIKEILVELSGLDKYSNNSQNIKIYNGEETSIETGDIPSEVTEEDYNTLEEKQFFYYTVVQGDTLFSLAQKFYGSYKGANIIGETNNLINEDFFEDALIGSSIKIPLLGQPVDSSLDSNLVYSSLSPLATPAERQQQVLGTDLNLSTNREVVSDGTGDLGMLYGENTYFENIKDRLSFPQGTLGEVNPDWGVPFGIGEIPSSIILLKIIDFIIQQVYSDPRTDYATLTVDDIELEGDRIIIPLKTKPLSGSENVLDAGALLPGQLLLGG